jgi:hypothetical protein
MRAALLAGVLAVAVAVPSGCAGEPSFGGQCHAPYQFDVLFQPSASRAIATAVPRACADRPTVVRLGPVSRLRTGQWQGIKGALADRVRCRSPAYPELQRGRSEHKRPLVRFDEPLAALSP